MLITHDDGKDYIALAIAIDWEAGVLNYYPLDSIIALQHIEGELTGHPRYDLPVEERMGEKLPPHRLKALDRWTAAGYVVIARPQETRTRFSRVRWEKLNLTEQQRQWLQVYAQYTWDYLPEFEARQAAELAPKPKPRPKPKPKLKLKRKDRRRREQAKQQGVDFAESTR